MIDDYIPIAETCIICGCAMKQTKQRGSYREAKCFKIQNIVRHLVISFSSKEENIYNDKNAISEYCVWSDTRDNTISEEFMYNNYVFHRVFKVDTNQCSLEINRYFKKENDKYCHETVILTGKKAKEFNHNNILNIDKKWNIYLIMS